MLNLVSTPQSGRKMLAQYRGKPERFWRQLRRKHGLQLFRAMSRKVSAYKKFLRAAGIRTQSIKTATDLKRIPAIHKKNYFHKFPFDQLMWDDLLKHEGQVMTATSGS